MIIHQDKYRDFYEQVGECYPEEAVVYKTLRGIVRKKFVLEYLNKFHGKLLDLGCNRGYYLKEFKNGTRYGIDIAWSVLREAKKRIPQAYFVQGDIQQLQFIRSNSMDAILCSEVIEHLLNPEKVFAETFRILKPGGKMLITTPNYTKKRTAWIKVGSLKKYGIHGMCEDYYFHTAYRPEELKNFAEKAGFTILKFGTLEKEVRYATRFPVVFFYMVYFINKYLIKSENLDNFNQKCLEACSLFIYRFARLLGINELLTRFVKEGVRSYIYVMKPFTEQP